MVVPIADFGAGGDGCAATTGDCTGVVGASISVGRKDRSTLLACSRAVAKARTFANRSCGFLASALITTYSTSGEMLGSLACRDGGGTIVCLMVSSEKVP